MAEVAVSAALLMVEIALPFLETLYSQKNIRNSDIKSMQSWLTLMKAYMEDNCGRAESRIQEDQINKVREIAYDIEDVLEEIVLHSPPYVFHSHKITRKFHNFAHQIHQGFPLHAISNKILEINQAIVDIERQLPFRDPNLQTSSSSSGTSGINAVHHTVISPLLLDYKMVGYEKPKIEFMRHLVGGETRLLTLAVNGPGGSGKTAFVKNVFWKQEIRGMFDCHAWVHVSRSCDVEQLLINLLKQLCGSRKEPYPLEDGSTTPQKLRRYLAGKRYIVALDDIWNKEDWDFIKNALPYANRGSRIIFTTRSSNLASSCASLSEHVYSLDNLEWLQGWKLFCRKAFPDSNGECPSDLKDYSVKIVKRCEGLPPWLLWR